MKKNIRVLQINAVYKINSTGRSVQEMHKCFLQKGIESFVAAADLQGMSNRCYKIGCQLDRKVHALLSRLTGRQGCFSMIATYLLLRYISKIKPDIVVLHNLHGNYINYPMLVNYLSKRDIAIVIVLHDNWFYTGHCVYYIEKNCYRWITGCKKCPLLKQGNVSWFLDNSKSDWELKKQLFDNVNRLAIIGVSQWIADDAKRSILSRAKYICNIYNWVDLEIFKPRKVDAKKYGLANDKITIIGVATCWTKEKGICVFEELSRTLGNEYQIVLLGEYNGVENNIISLGTITNVHQLSDIYNIADVFVNPSIQETFGKTTAEAMACGTPVVALGNTAMPELIGRDGKCGLLVEKQEVSEYLAKIHIIEKYGKKKYSTFCRKRAEELFSMRRNINRYVKLFKMIIQK